ncbi:MAG: riboflavin synthase [Zestosphaera tikiterensis]|uniref:Riboflavin synthase n=1 Tax=Zestosphaera tikiterensis TaxID=1973259 RepID=A0A2R7Y4B7_9CREN|nr:MAG: riboflavin synthase [Zestosphaera tikiterensis]
MSIKVGIVDTTFARVDMGSVAEKTLKEIAPNALIYRYTVPGIKDIPVAAKKLIEEKGCDGVITLGWVGSTLTDKLSYVVASLALQLVQLKTNKHIIDVTVHEDEAEKPEELVKIALDRTVKHCRNLVTLVTQGGEGLRRYAGKGLRQGREDVGPLTKT